MFSDDNYSSLPPLLVDPCVRKYVEESYDDDGEQVDMLLRSLGSPPGFTSLRVNTRFCSRQTAEEHLEIELKKQYSGKRLPAPEILTHQDLPNVLLIKNRGPNKTCDCEQEVIVGLGCAMAVLRGAHVFAQGVMAAPPGVQCGDHVAVYGDLHGTCRRGFIKRFEGDKIFVGTGKMCLSRSDLFGGDSAGVSGLAVVIDDPLYDAPSLNDVLPHMIFPQNLPSIVCGHVLNPQPGERVLDVCAAPGGKTVHLATLIKDKGQIIAFDKNKKKIDKIKENATRWGITCIEAYVQDGTKSCDPEAAMSSSPPYPPETFDRVLLDTPCSALGQRPSSKCSMTITEVKSYPPLQAKLFTQAVAHLRSGGVLVYSTCTVFKEENEMRVAWALSKFPQLKLLSQKPHLGGTGLSVPGLASEQQSLLQRFDPRHVVHNTDSGPETDTIGFFIAAFVKT